MPAVLCLDVVPWEIVSVHTEMAIDITIVLVSFTQPFLGETISQQTSWNSDSYNLLHSIRDIP